MKEQHYDAGIDFAEYPEHGQYSGENDFHPEDNLLRIMLASSNKDQPDLLGWELDEDLPGVLAGALLYQIDPESIYDEVEEEKFVEPLGSPVEAVEAKLRVTRENHPMESGIDFIFATDVGFKVDGVSGHKKDRGNIDHEEEIDKLIDQYCKKEGFNAEWEIAFGVMDSDGEVNIGTITISAFYEGGLEENDVRERYLTVSNAGLPLLEMGLEKGVIFDIASEELAFRGKEVVKGRPNYEQVAKFVISKLPTSEMLLELISGLMGEQAFEGMGLTAQGAMVSA